MVNLPIELIEQIVGNIKNDTNTLFSLCLVSRNWYLAVNKILYRHVTIHCGVESRKLRESCRKNRISQLVKYVSYYCSHQVCDPQDNISDLTFPNMVSIDIKRGGWCPCLETFLDKNNNHLRTLDLTGPSHEEFIQLDKLSRLEKLTINEYVPNVNVEKFFEHQIKHLSSLSPSYQSHNSRTQQAQEKQPILPLQDFGYVGQGVNEETLIKRIPFFSCLGLTSLTLISGRSTTLSDSTVLSLLKAVSNTLTRLELRVVGLSPTLLAQAAPHLSNLKQLIFECDTFDESCIYQHYHDILCHSISHNLIPHAPNLQHLEISINGSSSFFNLPDFFFGHIFTLQQQHLLLSSRKDKIHQSSAIPPASKLKIVRLDNYMINQDCISRIIEHLPNLHEMVFGLNANINKKVDLRSCVLSLNKLEFLKVYLVTVPRFVTHLFSKQDLQSWRQKSLDNSLRVCGKNHALLSTDTLTHGNLILSL